MLLYSSLKVRSLKAAVAILFTVLVCPLSPPQGFETAGAASSYTAAESRGNADARAHGGKQNSGQQNEVGSSEELFDQAAKLAAEWNKTSLQNAVALLTEARRRSQSVANKHDEVRALLAAANLLISLSDYPNVLKASQEALALSSTPHEQIQSLNTLSVVSLFVGDQKKALSYCERAYGLSVSSHDSRNQAESLVNLGEVQYLMGENLKSLNTMNRALSIWPDPQWKVRARALINKGYAYYDLRDMDQAESHYTQALTQSREQGDRRGEALALTAIGAVYSYQGNKQSALGYQNQAVTLFRTIGDRNGEGVSLNGLGYAYRNLGENERSLDCYLQALQLFRELGSREYETFALTRVGLAYEKLDNPTQALAYYQMVLERSVVYSQTRAHALNSMGTVLESMGKLQEALKYYNESVQLFRATGDKMGEASVLNSVGKVYWALGQRLKGMRSCQRALSIARAARDRRQEIAVLANIAKAERDTGDYVAARKSIEHSLKAIEELRSEAISATQRSSYFASVREHYELYIDVLMHLHKVDSKGGFAEQALAASEKARARSFLELLEESKASFREGVDQGLIQRQQALQRQLNTKAEQHRRLVASKQTAAALELIKEIDRLSIECDQLEAQIRQANPRFAALTQPRVITIKEIQEQILDDNTLLLEIALGDESSYLWAVTRAEVSAYELPARHELEAAARSVYSALTADQRSVVGATDEITARATTLSKMVIDNVAPMLGNKRLLIVPDGALQYIPFQVLTKPRNNSLDSSDRVPLLEDHEIINEPSASTMALLGRQGIAPRQFSKSVAVLADPVFEVNDSRVNFAAAQQPESGSNRQTTELHRALDDSGITSSDGAIPRLPASRDEANAIISSTPWGSGFKATGFGASRATAMNPKLANYRIIHFATHGLLSRQHPELSGIVLSLVDKNGNAQDGFLRLHDIYNLKLPVELVVLSACNTGLGKDVRGEGLIGLTRGFMYAGALSVVASLWKVDDEATAELMRHFYKFMLRDNFSPAAALREAQLELRKQKRWQSPYYWSGFIIQGQYVQRQTPSRVKWNPVVVTAVSIALIGIVALLFRRRRKNVF